eukprot:851470-Prymnesium_polylepis.1
MEVVSHASRFAADVEAAQRKHVYNAQRLERVLAAKVPPADTDVTALRAAHDAVMTSGKVLSSIGHRKTRRYEPVAMLEAAQARLRESDEVQAAVAKDICTLVLLAEPLACDGRGLGAARSALKEAEKGRKDAAGRDCAPLPAELLAV